jgi:thymidylate synthase ThyX
MIRDLVQESFTPEERAILQQHFTNLDGPVFALVNLPEVVKGALFARYSRSAKSLRRLFLDEFVKDAGQAFGQGPPTDVGVRRAEELYERIFLEYGDDSVAQLGGVHLAVEQVSQPLAKVLEWGRLAAYLEQSTRYVPFDDQPGGRWRYHMPHEVLSDPGIARRYQATLDRAFETYARWLGPMQDFYREQYPQDGSDSDFVYRMTIRAKACDALRGLLPAATRTNVGIFATAQAYEQLLLRMRADPLSEVQAFADLILEELRKLIPAFLTRVDLPDRGGAWTEYLGQAKRSTAGVASDLLEGIEPEPRPEVTLVDFDPDGEVKVVAAALYAAGELPDDQLLDLTRKMSVEDRARVLAAYVGQRGNRRHKPGRAFERTSYRFDVICDYGAFRDLQRHRLLTLEWQQLSTALGFELPADVEAAGALPDWNAVMDEGDSLHAALRAEGMGPAAQYAVPMAYRVRFYMDMNAREAMHLIELRTTPQGHPVYRRIGQQMHRLIAEQAGHHAIAQAMKYADHTGVELERLEAERKSERKRAALGSPPESAGQAGR